MLDRSTVVLLVRDPGVLVSLQPALAAAGITSEIYTDEVRTIAMCMRCHYDGFVVDFNRGSATAAVVCGIRATPSNKTSPIIGFVQAASIRTALELGVSIFLDKTGRAGQSDQLPPAVVAITKEHARYARFPVTAPVLIGCEDGRVFEGTMENVSLAGLRIRFPGEQVPTRKLRLKFFLPVPHRPIFEAQGEVVWSDESGRSGIHLASLPTSPDVDFPKCLRALQQRKLGYPRP